MNGDTRNSGKLAQSGDEVGSMWRVLWFQSLFLPLLIAGTQRFMPGRPLVPGAAPYTLLAGVLLGLLSLPMLWRFRRSVRENGGTAVDSADRILRLRRQLMLGVSIADFPALAGVLHYFLTRNTAQSLLLCGATVILVYLYRPRW